MRASKNFPKREPPKKQLTCEECAKKRGCSVLNRRGLCKDFKLKATRTINSS